jgi:5-methylcytosine-specific restriction endonuclease McrA
MPSWPACPVCGNERGHFKRCYRCNPRGPRKHYLGEFRACAVCGTLKYFQPNQISAGEGLYCSRACKHVAQTGRTQKNSHGIGHTYPRKDGYIAIKAKVGKQYELEHRVMMALLRGKPLEEWEEVHHHDLDRSHNCPGNLEIVANGAHQDLHQALHPRPSRQVLVTCALPGCGLTKMVKASRATGDRYCGNEHRLEAMHQKAREYHADNRAGRGYDASWPERPFPGDYGPNWPDQRDACLARDGYQCQWCGTDKDLMAAHRIPRGRFALDDYETANALENLITLCRGCHISFDFEQGVR